MFNKKGQVFDQLTGLGIGIASLVIIFAVMFLILSNVETQIVDVQNIPANYTTDTMQRTTALNATIDLAVAADAVPGWVPLIVIASIGATLIGLVALFRRN